jgi:hypothetical protein
MTGMTAAPPGALTWETPAQRNKQLRLWGRAVRSVFGEQTRCLRVAWVLADLFNAKTGYAFPTNKCLAEETGIAENKVQEALRDLEQGRAIVRQTIRRDSGQKQRVIYPGRAILPTPTVGVWGDPQQPGVQNLRRRTRLPRSELERARLAAMLRDQAEHRARGTNGSGPSEDVLDAEAFTTARH